MPRPVRPPLPKALRSGPSASLLDLPSPHLVALVTRVSTERQAANDEGSLKTQLQVLRAYMDQRRTCGERWQESDTYVLRAVSGKHSIAGPELQQLYADIASGRVNTVLCTRLDRLSRSVSEFLQFIEFSAHHGAEFVCLREKYDTTTPPGKFFVTVMVALAQFEREQTAQRTRDAVAARSERGLWNGGRLFGYDLDPDHKGYLLVNEQEAEVVRCAFATYLEVGSLAGCVDALNAAGYRSPAYTSRSGTTRPAKPFYVSRLQTLLQNPAYVGLKELDKNARVRSRGRDAPKRSVPAVWPPLIDQATFDAVQALMRANGQTRTNQAREVRHAYVLSGGLLLCGACDSPMEGRSGTGRLGKTYHYYACKNPACKLRVVAPEIEGAILDRLGVLAQDPVLLAQTVAATNARLQRQLPALTKRRRALARELADVQGQVTKLLTHMGALDGTRSQKLLTSQLDTLAERQEQLEASLRAIDDDVTQVQAAALTTHQAQQALAQISALYDCLQPLEQKELFRLLVHRAVVFPQRIALELYTTALTPEAVSPQPLAPAYNALSDLIGSPFWIRTPGTLVNIRLPLRGRSCQFPTWTPSTQPAFRGHILGFDRCRMQSWVT